MGARLHARITQVMLNPHEKPARGAAAHDDRDRAQHYTEFKV
ncbi:hypothetical protein MCEMSEM23_02142 [Rhabdaerophilaceae bacterium]